MYKKRKKLYINPSSNDEVSLWFRDGFEGGGTAVSGVLASMRSLVGAVGEACPAAAGGLEAEAFDDGVFRGFIGVRRDGACVVRDEFVLAIVTGVGVPEVA